GDLRFPAGASGGRGAGASCGAPSAAGRPATAVASARPTTRQRRRSSAGRSTTGWAPFASGIPRGSATGTPAGADPAASQLGADPSDRRPEGQGADGGHGGGGGGRAGDLLDLPGLP